MFGSTLLVLVFVVCFWPVGIVIVAVVVIVTVVVVVVVVVLVVVVVVVVRANSNNDKTRILCFGRWFRLFAVVVSLIVVVAC